MYNLEFTDQQDQYEQIATQEEYREEMAEKALVSKFGVDDDE